jgi:hypothetical protein
MISVQGYDASGDRYEQGASSPAAKPCTLSGISPNTAVKGSANITVTCTGTNFSAPMRVNFGDQALACTVVSATSATFVAPVAARTTTGVVPVSVQVGQFASGPQNFTFT